MKRFMWVFLFLILFTNQAFPQKATRGFKKEEIEIGLKLSQTSEILKEEAKRYFEIIPLKTIPLSSYSYRASCNGDNCAFSLKDGKVVVYDWKEGRVIYEENFSKNPIYTVAVHPFKNIICFGDREGRITIFDLDKKIRLHTIYEVDKAISDVKFSPDGRLLGVAYLETGDIDVYNIENYEKLQTIKAHGGGIYYIAFSPNQDLIVSGSRDKKVSITPRGERWPSQILGKHRSLVLSLDFSKDKSFLASVGADAQLIVWKIKDDSIEEEPYFTWIHGDWVNTVKFFKDYLITGSKDGSVRIFNYKDKKILGNFKYSQTIFSIDITPGGEYLFAASKDILIYDLREILEKTGGN